MVYPVTCQPTQSQTPKRQESANEWTQLLEQFWNIGTLHGEHRRVVLPTRFIFPRAMDIEYSRRCVQLNGVMVADQSSYQDHLVLPELDCQIAKFNPDCIVRYLERNNCLAHRSPCRRRWAHLPRILDQVRCVLPNALVCTLPTAMNSSASSSLRKGVNRAVVKLTYGKGDNSFGPPVIVFTQRLPSR